MYNGFEAEIPTTELYLPTIISREACGAHKAPVGQACFHIPSGEIVGASLLGVCNRRARRAGFNHPIGMNSMRMRRKV